MTDPGLERLLDALDCAQQALDHDAAVCVEPQVMRDALRLHCLRQRLGDRVQDSVYCAHLQATAERVLF